MDKPINLLRNGFIFCLLKYLTLFFCSISTGLTCIFYTNKYITKDGISPFSIQRPIFTLIFCIIATSSCYFLHRKTFPSFTVSLKIFGVALLLNLFFNLEYFDHLWILFPAITLTIALIYLSFSFCKILAVFLWVFIIFLMYVSTVIFIKMGFTLNFNTLTQIAAASSDEITSFLSLGNILFVIIGISLALIFSFIIYNTLKKTDKVTLLTQGSFYILISVTFLYFSSSNIYNWHAGAIWPLHELKRIVTESINANSANQNFIKFTLSLPPAATQRTSILPYTAKSGIVCILHIGESVRYDRLSLNGWKNDTTPNLVKLKENNRLINFSQCKSSNWLTLSATTNILTNSETFHYLELNKFSPVCGSVSSALAKNLFDCYYLIEESNIKEMKDDSIFTTMMFSFSRGHADLIRTKKPSENQIKHLKTIVDSSPQKNHFFILNNCGSHMPFFMYNHENPPFTPCDSYAFYRSPRTDKRDFELANNAYDNTIHYTDTYIQKAIDSLKGKPFIYIYISDHGEYIGHHGLWNRGSFSSVEDYHKTSGSHIPFFIIYSPEFESIHPHFANSIRELKNNANHSSSHGNIFHTLLGLFGIQSPYYERLKDLSNPHFQRININN